VRIESDTRNNITFNILGAHALSVFSQSSGSKCFATAIRRSTPRRDLPANPSGRAAWSANPAQKATFEKGIPQQNMSASASYAVGPVKVLGRVRYYGSWTDSTGNTTGDRLQSFGSINMVAVAVSYDVLSNLTGTIGADNVFISYPDQASFQASRGLIYSRSSP
jgi:iron complex outermembrane receptor protein